MDMDCTSPLKGDNPIQLTTPNHSGEKRMWRDRNFRRLYKTSPRWLQSYRDRCLQESAHRRQERQSELIERFRKITTDSQNDPNNVPEDYKDRIIQQVMKDFLKQLDQEIINDDGDDEVFFSIENELQSIQEDLMNEELEYFEALLGERDEELFESQFATICTQCRQCNWEIHQNLPKTSSDIWCPGCYFYITLPFLISEEELNNLITGYVDQHFLEQQCHQVIRFTPVQSSHNSIEYNYFSNIRLECQSCKFDKLLFSLTD